ncbi:MAG: DUF433 domain-containing protein [Verrucomicrobiota bacterium]|jgi:uncharacterized protein (DUF433 family)
MSSLNMTQTVPLTRDDEGVLRVIGSRVTLDSIVHLFKSGATAEQIQEDFPSLALGDIYSVIAYYLQHSSQVEDYLRQQAGDVKELQNAVESGLSTREIRERLRQRLAHVAT